MKAFPARIASLYAELKRRKVVRTAIAYGVAAAAIIQLTDAVAGGLRLPDDTLKVVILTVAAGFPFALLLAWLFEVSREAPVPEPVVSTTESEQAAPTAALHAPRVYRCDLPPTPLIAREAELNAALNFLGESNCRILTITGPGGIGKTRLAQEVGSRAVERFAHGACFVSLSAIESVESLPAALADGLGFVLSARESASKQLAGFLREKEVLLVLDNFEHIVEGAGLISELVLRAPGVCVLATSRRRLRIAGETVLALEALSLPANDAPVANSAAARMFLQMATRSDPRFLPDNDEMAAIVRICHMTGGIPLAIELAAAAVGVLSCKEIARELEQSHDLVVGARRDVPLKHRTLHATFESSWRLLEGEERRVFAALSAFRSSFDLVDAQVVARADLQLLARLVEVSLLHRPANGSFAVLEVLRQFGEEKLVADDRTARAVRRRHKQYFLSQLSELDTIPDGLAREAQIEQLALRTADVRAAWNRAISECACSDLRSAARGLFSLLEARGRSAEGADLFKRAVAVLRPVAGHDVDATPALGRLLPRQAAFLVELGHVSEAADLLSEAITLLQPEGEDADVAFAMHKQCVIARMNGDFASPVFEETLALYRRLGDLPGVARALNSLGTVRQALGKYDEARQLYQESVQLFRRVGLAGEAWVGLNNLAGIAQLQGNLAGARRILEEELSVARTRKNPRALSFLLTNLAMIASQDGDVAAARTFLAESVDLARAMGYRGRLAYCLNTLAGLYLRAGEIDNAAPAYYDALATAIDAEEGPLVPSILVGVARLHLRRGDAARAASILKAVESHPSCDDETRCDARDVLQTVDAPVLVQNPAPMPLEEILRGIRVLNGQAVPA